MSEKELKRRKVCSFVLKEAWKIRKKTRLYVLSLSAALRLIWGKIKGLIKMRYSKVRGTTFENRQIILKRLSYYDPKDVSLYFQREPNNPVDSNAIKIMAHIFGKGSAAIGYLAKELAHEIATYMDEDREVVVLFDGITGLNHETLGCNFIYAIL